MSNGRMRRLQRQIIQLKEENESLREENLSLKRENEALKKKLSAYEESPPRKKIIYKANTTRKQKKPGRRPGHTGTSGKSLSVSMP